MKRDPRGSIAFWDKWIAFFSKSIQESWERLAQPAGDPGYRPQYAFELAKDHYELMLRRYSRGDESDQLPQYFLGLLDAWEESDRLGKEVWDEKVQYARHSWRLNIDHYIRCFWLTGLALLFNIPDEQWHRLVSLMGNEGEDALLDRVIASRQPGRSIGKNLCFPKAYRPLLELIDASPELRPELLRGFLDGWFSSLEDAGSPELPREFRTPYWWTLYADEDLGMQGAYFGCWCIESAVVSKVFGINDAICLSHPNYPGDLLEDGRSPRYPDPPQDSVPMNLLFSKPLSLGSWVRRLLGSR